MRYASRAILAVRQHACPSCGARPGWPCASLRCPPAHVHPENVLDRRHDGRLAVDPHAARMALVTP